MPAQADAYQTYNDHVLVYGVTGQEYWLDTTAASNNSTAIHDGVALWNATATPVSYSETATKSESRMDFYNDGDINSPNCAYTWWYVDTTRVVAANQNWWWSPIYTTPVLKNTEACGVEGHRKAIVAHEQGHVMGLDHAVNSDRLMYSGISGTTINAPQPDDINGINYLY